MVHHYVKKGWKAEEFLALPLRDKLFYKASMEISMEEDGQKFAAYFKTLAATLGGGS